MRCDSQEHDLLVGMCKVSIPGGFSCALRLIEAAEGGTSSGGFQSLAGFLVRCDVNFIWSNAGQHVSIPGGFSCALRPLSGADCAGTVTIVSIPGGFSCALRPPAELDHRLMRFRVSIPGGFSCALRR